MLLTISTTHQPATDLGYLLHKHPDRVQQFSQSFGVATVFYPVATAERCTVALLLEVDPVRLARSRATGLPDFSLGVHRRREGRYTFHDLDTTPLAPLRERWVRPDERTGPCGSP